MEDVLNFLKDHWATVIPWLGIIAVAVVGYFRGPLRQFDSERRDALRAVHSCQNLDLRASPQQRQEVDDQLRKAADTIRTYAGNPSFTIRTYCRLKKFDLEGAAASLQALRHPVFLDGNLDHQKLKADSVRACLGATKGMPSSRIKEARLAAQRSANALSAQYNLDVGGDHSAALGTFFVALRHVSALWEVRWSLLDAFFRSVLARKLDAIPSEHLNARPRSEVIMPSLNAIPLVHDNPVLQELWANLIASEMDKRTADGVLPSFGEILKELTSDEAKILDAIKDGDDVPIVRIQQAVFKEGHKTGAEDVEKNLSHIGFKAGCQFPRQAPAYLDNLARLRLIEFLAYGTKYPDHLYTDLKADPEIEKLRLQYHQPPERQASYIPSGLELTALGRSFIKACVAQKTPPALGG